MLSEKRHFHLAAQKKFLEKQIMMEGYDMQIALCSRHPQEIIEAVAADPKRGIYFLDVELKDEPITWKRWIIS